MAMKKLPRFFVMQANSQSAYLGEHPPLGFLNFDVRDIFDPRVKFATDKSAGGDHTLVHIRCCQTNKYWVVNEVQGRLWICASAAKPEEDTKNPACTLFRLTSGSVDQTFGFLSIAKNMNVTVSNDNSLELGVDATFFPTVDWETLVILPSQVTFRSKELDGYYLCSSGSKYNPELMFMPKSDVGDPLAAFELFPTPDGNYRIKDIHFMKFWRRSGNNLIVPDAEEENRSNDTLFSFVKLSDSVFALRNLVDNFCGAINDKERTNVLQAGYPTISRHTKLMVEERVVEREIFDLRYSLSDSRIYEEEIQEVSHAIATNKSHDKETTVTLSYSSSDSRTTTWTSSVSVTLGVTIKFETSIIPFINTEEVELSFESGYTHEWGVAEKTERKREASYVVVVPPLTTMKVTLMSTRAVCDVPFSYTQRDLLTNGKWVTTIKDDGIFTGINSYNFRFESTDVGKDGI